MSGQGALAEGQSRDGNQQNTATSKVGGLGSYRGVYLAHVVSGVLASYIALWLTISNLLTNPQAYESNGLALILLVPALPIWALLVVHGILITALYATPPLANKMFQFFEKSRSYTNNRLAPRSLHGRHIVYFAIGLSSIYAADAAINLFLYIAGVQALITPIYVVAVYWVLSLVVLDLTTIENPAQT